MSRLGLLSHISIGALWAFLMAVTFGVVLSLISGDGFRPPYLLWLLSGGITGLALWFWDGPGRGLICAGLLIVLAAALTLMHPFGFPVLDRPLWSLLGLAFAGGLAGILIAHNLAPLQGDSANRYRLEETLSRFIRGFGMLFFGVIVIIPLYLMVAGSLYTSPSSPGHNFAALPSAAKAIADPFRAYYNLFGAKDAAAASNFFGRYFLNSVWVSLATVLITLALAVPGAYAISRLHFPGQRLLSRSILMIYLVPVIVLVIPLFVILTKLGLRNSFGLLLVYPATTLPVALYMLQGYFRGLPAELEEAGLMDGCSRLRVIWSITIPLALPAIASVALYVFMIAWNEFLIAFMLLADPSTYTLPIGINAMNSSEVAEQDLMAAAVVATVPIVVLFLWAERYMVRGLASGGVKG